MLKGEAKKEYQRDYMRRKRAVRPNEDVRPLLDPSVRPYSKEEQLSVKASKKQANKEATFNKLKARYDVRPT